MESLPGIILILPIHQKQQNGVQKRTPCHFLVLTRKIPAAMDIVAKRIIRIKTGKGAIVTARILYKTSFSDCRNSDRTPTPPRTPDRDIRSREALSASFA